MLGSAPMSILPAGGRRSPSGLRFPALLWALLHVPVFLALYAPSIRGAVQATPEVYRAWLWPTFLPQALLLALLAFALALPAAPWPRAYRLLAPGAAGLLTAGLALDAKVFESVGYHLNGFFFQLMLQPHALREAGVPAADVALFLAGGLPVRGGHVENNPDIARAVLAEILHHKLASVRRAAPVDTGKAVAAGVFPHTGEVPARAPGDPSAGRGIPGGEKGSK